LVEGDVLTARLPPVDLVLAMNFSYWVFKERTPYRGYTYVWHQAAYDPISGDTLCHIDFKFEDGSRLRRASATTGGCGLRVRSQSKSSLHVVV